MELSVRKIAIAGMLGAVTILLGLAPIGGFIPFPTGVNATTLHIPAILGGVLEGWGVGGLVGLLFGLFSFLRSTTPLFKDPLVAILPRLFIGITAALTYGGLRRTNEQLAVGVAAAVGTLTNTLLVLGLAVLRGYMAVGFAAVVAVTHGLPEVVVAVIITVAVATAWKRIDTGRGASRL
jgi:uncharacterized membrane protein